MTIRKRRELKMHRLRCDGEGHFDSEIKLLSHLDSALFMIVFDARMKQNDTWLCYDSEFFDDRYQS